MVEKSMSLFSLLDLSKSVERININNMVEPPPEFGGGSRRRTPSTEGRAENDEKSTFQGHLTQMVWEAGSQQVKDAFSSYGRIDLFRPYFDVDPKTVRNRLFQSLIPRKPSQMQIATDLYGPLMLIFTLVAILLFTMKSSGYSTQDGTLIGTAFFTCFGYWFFTSLALYTMCYVFTCDVQMVQIFSLLGYALFGHCIVLSSTALFHPVHSHLFFYLLLVIFAGSSCLRMSIFLMSKTRDRTHKLILAGVVTGLHLMFLLYLHFGFHTVLEEIDEMIHETVGNPPKGFGTVSGAPAAKIKTAGSLSGGKLSATG